MRYIAIMTPNIVSLYITVNFTINIDVIIVKHVHIELCVASHYHHRHDNSIIPKICIIVHCSCYILYFEVN